jgi:hypothetical protein
MVRVSADQSTPRHARGLSIGGLLDDGDAAGRLDRSQSIRPVLVGAGRDNSDYSRPVDLSG